MDKRVGCRQALPCVQLLFTARCYASAVLANSHGPVSVRLFIRLSVSHKSEFY